MKRQGQRSKKNVKIHRDQLVHTNFVKINASSDITSFVTADGKPNPERFAVLRCGLGPFLFYTLVLRPYKRCMFSGKINNTDKNKVGVELRDLIGNLETLGLTQFF